MSLLELPRRCYKSRDMQDVAKTLRPAARGSTDRESLEARQYCGSLGAKMRIGKGEVSR